MGNPKDILLRGHGPGVPAPHSCAGWIIAMATIPTVVNIRQQDGSLSPITVNLTKTAQCVKCGASWEFQHQNANMPAVVPPPPRVAEPGHAEGPVPAQEETKGPESAQG